MKLGNEFIEFKARFAGTAREIIVPVNRVLAIYARENGQGMAFPMPVQSAPASTEPSPKKTTPAPKKTLSSVEVSSSAHKPSDDEPPPPPSGGRPSLTRVK